ncbi:bcl-2-modifying factor [Rhinophrynus dorsalis]
MEPETYLSSDELEDDVFYPDDFEFPVQTLTPSAVFNQSPSYTCLLGRFQLFPLSHCCGPGCRTTDYEDKATQTLGPSSLSHDIMLPCGVSESPQRLFYGNAGYLLYLPLGSSIQFGGDVVSRRQEQSAERRIARKLQCIGDQFHRLHLQRLQHNRNQVWSQILNFFRNLVMQREMNRGEVGRRKTFPRRVLSLIPSNARSWEGNGVDFSTLGSICGGPEAWHSLERVELLAWAATSVFCLLALYVQLHLPKRRSPRSTGLGDISISLSASREFLSSSLKSILGDEVDNNVSSPPRSTAK